MEGHDIIECPECGQRMRVPPDSKATVFKCVKCGSRVERNITGNSIIDPPLDNCDVFYCTFCGKKTRVPANSQGKIFRCGRCHTKCRVRPLHNSDDAPPLLQMPDQRYTEDEPYVFISYSYEDAPQVYPEIMRLEEMKCRLWYSKGLPPDYSCPNAAAAAIIKADCFVVFITSTAAVTRYVNKEIAIATEANKPLLAVHLCMSVLPGAMGTPSDNLQQIFKWRMDEDTYTAELNRFLPKQVRVKT